VVLVSVIRGGAGVAAVFCLADRRRVVPMTLRAVRRVRSGTTPRVSSRDALSLITERESGVLSAAAEPAGGGEEQYRCHDDAQHHDA
jgi:hypothetical protein